MARESNCSTHTVKARIEQLGLIEIYENMLKEKEENHKCIICGIKDSLSTWVDNQYYCGKHISQLNKHGKILERTRFDKNEIIVYKELGYAEIFTYDRNGRQKNKAYIDIEDIGLISNYKWYSKDEGYLKTHIKRNGKDFKMSLHRLIMGVSEQDKSVEVDHIDRNPLNNRKDNLRICSHHGNCMNKSIQSNNTSGVTGVTWRKPEGMWEAQIKLNYINYHLGFFTEFEDAVRCRRNAEPIYFEDFSPIHDDYLNLSN